MNYDLPHRASCLPAASCTMGRKKWLSQGQGRKADITPLPSSCCPLLCRSRGTIIKAAPAMAAQGDPFLTAIGGKRSPAGFICSGTLAIYHEQDRWRGQRFLVAITIFFLNMRSGTK